MLIPGPLVADCGTVVNEPAAATGRGVAIALSRRQNRGARADSRHRRSMVIVGLAVGSATVLRPTTLLVAPPLNCWSSRRVSAPEPTWIEMQTPPGRGRAGRQARHARDVAGPQARDALACP